MAPHCCVKNLYSLIAWSGLCLILVACGGGGSSDTNTSSVTQSSRIEIPSSEANSLPASSSTLASSLSSPTSSEWSSLVNSSYVRTSRTNDTEQSSQNSTAESSSTGSFRSAPINPSSSPVVSSDASGSAVSSPSSNIASSAESNAASSEIIVNSSSAQSSSTQSSAQVGTKQDPDFGLLTLIDSVDAAQPGSRVVSVKPDGGAVTQTILGRKALVLPPRTNSASYAAFMIGEGRGLVAGKAYVLEFDYPDDVPRTMVFLNRGADLVRTLATGKEVGDYREQYAYPNPESLSYPHSGQWQTYRFYFHLHDRFLPLAGVRNEVDTKRPFGPEDGFWVAVGHYNSKGIPLSRGAVLGEVRLYEVNDPNAAKLTVNYPPAGLPHRRTYWREEMGDGPSLCQRGDSVVQTDPAAANYHAAGICNPATGTVQSSVLAWLEYKMRLSQILGINVFTKDLLEFGYNQGMSVTNYGGNNLYSNSRIAYWPQMVQKANSYGLEVMPYFEYYGAMGAGEFSAVNCPSVDMVGNNACINSLVHNAAQCRIPWGQSQPKCFMPSYGYQKPCEPLTRTTKRYTGVGWAEVACIDVSDPAALEDVKKLLNANLLDLRNDAKFAGVWFRTRVSSWPISFSAETRARYAQDRNRATPGKAELRGNSTLLSDYHSWWFAKRRAYLLAIRDYLRNGKNGNNGIAKASVLFTSYHEEGYPIPAPNWDDTKVVTDDVTSWNTVNLDDYWKWRYSPMSFSTWVGISAMKLCCLRCCYPQAGNYSVAVNLTR